MTWYKQDKTKQKNHKLSNRVERTRLILESTEKIAFSL